MNSKEIQLVAKKAGQVLVKNSPSILTGMGVTGVISTAVMAVRATPKAMEIIDNELCDRASALVSGRKCSISIEKLSKKEIFLLTWKCYVPTAIMGGMTIACIVGANGINLRRNAALASAYGLTEAALKEYKNKVAETFGENKVRQVKDAIAKDKIEKNPVKNDEIILTGKGETLCFDPYCARYFKSDIEKIRRVENDLKYEMLNGDTIYLNDVYYALGLPQSKIGEDMGWNVNYGLFGLDLSSQLTTDGVPCLVLGFKDEPVYSHHDF